MNLTAFTLLTLYASLIILSNAYFKPFPDDTLLFYGSFLTIEGSSINEPPLIHIHSHILGGHVAPITLTLHTIPSHSFTTYYISWLHLFLLVYTCYMYTLFHMLDRYLVCHYLCYIHMHVHLVFSCGCILYTNFCLALYLLPVPLRLLGASNSVHTTCVIVSFYTTSYSY